MFAIGNIINVRLATVLALCFVTVDGQFSQYSIPNIVQNLENGLKNRKLEVSVQCRNHLLNYIEDLKSGKPWALKMLDAESQLLPSGVLEGNRYSLGSFDQCMNINERKEDLQIFGKYCLATTYIESPTKRIKSNSTTDVLRLTKKVELVLAKCFPDACSIMEIEKLYGEGGYMISFNEELCQSKASQPKLDGAAIAGISLFGVIFAMVIASTVYDVVLYYFEKERNWSMLLAFSIFSNFRRFINTSEDPGEISCLNGIRVISMMWIIIAHQCLITFTFPITNSEYIYTWTQQTTNMYMSTIYLPVDTFLSMSGFLVSYNFMTQMEKGRKFNVISYYIRRYLRITATLAVLIIFHVTLLRHMGSGPLWSNKIEPMLIGNCETDWWRTMFHVVNIHNSKGSQCIPTSWYSTMDMQLIILSPLLLLPLKRWPRLTLLVTSILIVSSAVSSFLIARYYELNPMVIFNDVSTGQRFKYFWYNYMQFYTRSCTWLIGFMFGYLHFVSRDNKIKFLNSKTTISFLWLISLMIMLTCTFYGREFAFKDYSTITYTLHWLFARILWVLAVSWIIFACIRGYGGPVQWFLSLPLFKVLQKLTYTLFVCHWTVIAVRVYSARAIVPFSTFQLFFQFWGFYVYSLMVSLVLLLTIESPVANLMKLFM